MQFRDASSRVQCYAPFYDSASKRTRQKLVYILDKFGLIEAKPNPDDLTPADFGSPEQRTRWAEEIGIYIDQHNASYAKERVEALPLMLKSAADGIVADIKSTEPILTAWHRARIRTEVGRLARALGLVVMSKPKPEPGAKKTAPLGGLTSFAQRKRNNGMSVAEIARDLDVSQARIREWTTAPTKEPADEK